MVAGYLDAHHSGPLSDVLTERHPDGTVTSAAFMIPHSTEDLRRRRRVTEAVVDMTLGTMGRSPEFMPLLVLGLYAHRELFLKSDPDLGANLERYFEWARRNHPIMAWGFVDPQSDKRIAAAERGYLRVVERREDGIVLSGAKVVATLAAQADEIIVSTLWRPDLEPECAVWCALPVATPGVTLVCREGLAAPGRAVDHPLRSLGDEMDSMVLFDNVFVPWERVFNLGDVALPKNYTGFAMWTHWYAFMRLIRRTELLAGIASLIPKVIGTKDIPQVKDMVADVLRYLETCTAMRDAAEEHHGVVGGVAHVEPRINNAGRLFANENMPTISHTLRELSGQGLIMRFPDSVFDSDQVGTMVERAITGLDYTGREKTRLFNLVWDLVCDSFGARLELFDQFNSLSVPVLRQVWFNGYDKAKLAELEQRVRDITQLPAPKTA
jgi:4-hydroxyphenylacetate 3-monooxygenase